MRYLATVVFALMPLLLVGCSDKFISDVNASSAEPKKGLRPSAPKAIRHWQVGDTWEYGVHEVLPGTLTVKVVGIRQRTDNNGQDFLLSYHEKMYRGRGRGASGAGDPWVNAYRQYVFTQYSDGSLVSQGSIDGDHVHPSIDWVAGQYLPALKSPLTVGATESFPNASVTDPTNSTPGICDVDFKTVGVETMWVEQKAVDVFRVDAQQTIHSRREGDNSVLVEGWTDWYSPDLWLVKRERRLNSKIFGVPTSVSMTLDLRKFTPGK